MKKSDFKTDTNFLAYCEDQAAGVDISPTCWLEDEDGIESGELYCEQCIDAQEAKPENIADGWTVVRWSTDCEWETPQVCESCGRLLESSLTEDGYINEIKSMIEVGQMAAEDFATVADFMNGGLYSNGLHWPLIRRLAGVIYRAEREEKGRA